MSEEKRTELYAIVTEMAQQGLRTLCLAYRDFPETANAQEDSFDVPPEEQLTACCIVGIKVLPPPFPPHLEASTSLAIASLTLKAGCRETAATGRGESSNKQTFYSSKIKLVIVALHEEGQVMLLKAEVFISLHTPY